MITAKRIVFCSFFVELTFIMGCDIINIISQEVQKKWVLKYQ